ncbi:hypothetical protein CY34DRAFT_800933 [Suillus luteus UH-Slu-Lm8-n1]|uniref:Uncharacterized protein n=1 Tax=Suillus luteus UH-Slu-Lm8-n1 TaxID=930992 RepID=A0A0D0BSR8_9AGAM|nr:hypothetical protein CY34DRAFT_800933 [Suillus luteus UH-Slu-Lm8-n1]
MKGVEICPFYMLGEVALVHRGSPPTHQGDPSAYCGSVGATCGAILEPVTFLYNTDMGPRQEKLRSRMTCHGGLTI